MSIELWIMIVLWSVGGALLGTWVLDQMVFDEPRPKWYKLVILVILMGPLMYLTLAIFWIVTKPIAYFLDWVTS